MHLNTRPPDLPVCSPCLELIRIDRLLGKRVCVGERERDVDSVNVKI